MPKKQYEAPKLKVYFKFPYIGTQSDKLKMYINKITNKYFTYIDPVLIFINKFKI